MTHAFICDAIRTPFGRYGGALSSVRTDDLGAIPIRALMARNPKVDWQAVADVLYGCANQAGEDNRNVARMAALLAGLPIEVPGATINRLCGSGLDAVGTAARAIRCGEAQLMIAGGVESMSRAPFVMPKAESAFSRANAVYDTTIGWRFVNKLMKAQYGVDSMPETAENVAEQFKIEREAQDRMALASPAEGGGGAEERLLRARDHAGEHRAEEGRPAHRRQGRTPARDLDGSAGQAQGRGQARGHGDGRQCQRRQRRCLRAAAGQRGRRRAPRPEAARARGRHGHGRRGAAHHGLRPGAGGAQGAGADRPVAEADGRDRAQRSLRRAGPGGAARPGAWPTTTRASTRTAAPSRWATRWAPAARGWRPPR